MFPCTHAMRTRTRLRTMLTIGRGLVPAGQVGSLSLACVCVCVFWGMDGGGGAVAVAAGSLMTLLYVGFAILLWNSAG